MTTRQRNKILHKLSYNHKNRAEIFLELDIHDRPGVLLRLSKHVQTQLSKSLDDETMIELVDHLDPDDATDVLRRLPKKRQQRIIEQMSEQLKESVATLLNFDPETAAGLMNLNYITVRPSKKIKEMAELVHRHESRTGRLPTILVTEEGKLHGQLSGYKLGIAKPDDTVDQHVKKIRTISYDAKSSEVLKKFKDNPHRKVVVLGEKKQVLGVIYTDDILNLINAIEGSSLYNFAGVSDEESVYDTTARKVNFRYKWLIINLGTAFMASFTIGLFNETISKFVLLAVYMPIVAGMGGNAATQTLAVMVRGLSQSSLTASAILQTLKNEMAAGIINGLINGLIVFGVVLAVNKDLKMGIVLASAMVINLLVAGTAGTLVPVVMKKLGKDPAASATVFITAFTDVLGFLAFLGLATLVL